MSDPDRLGGRTALLAPDALIPAQRKVYDTIDKEMVPWAEKAGFQAKLPDGRLIGPFNTILLSPEMGEAFLSLQGVEGESSSLSARVRQVVILTVGAVWRCDYERYAHAAVAREVGLSAATIAALRNGEHPSGLSDEEDVARRFTLALTAERAVSDGLFEEARSMFQDRGIVDIIILAGCYGLISSLLNAFDVPVPNQSN